MCPAECNIIGTRGKDKVVQVAVSTVIHLLKGELPSTVQSCSTTALYPWELQGTLHTDQLESHQQSVSKSISMPEEVESLDSTGASSNQDQGTAQELASRQASQEVSKNVEHVQYNVAELTKPGQQIIIARGREGGLDNVSSPTVPEKGKLGKPRLNKNSAFDPAISCDDKFSRSMGLPSSEAVLVLDLKSIADVGLVGMPNAGKITLLGALSREKPRIGQGLRKFTKN